MKYRRLLAYSALFVSIITSIIFFGCQQHGNPYPPGLFAVWNIDSLYAIPDPLRASRYDNKVCAHVVDSKGNPMPTSEAVFFSAVINNEPMDWQESASPNEKGTACVYLSLVGVEIPAESTIIVIAKAYGREEYSKSKIFRIVGPDYSPPAQIRLVLRQPIYSGSGDTAWIDVIVTDSAGGPAPGVKVGFSVEAGTARLTKSSLTTNSDGMGLVGVVEPGHPETTIVKGYITSEPSINDTVRVPIIEPIASSIRLSVDPDTAIANGRDTIKITAFVTVGESRLPAPDGMPVWIWVEHGHLFGVRWLKTPFGLISRRLESKRNSFAGPESILVYTVDGQANAFLQADYTIGRVMVVARANPLADTAYVRFLPGPPAHIDLYAEDTILTANGADNTMISAILTDQFGNRVSAGYPVAFNASSGEVYPEVAYTNDTGVATVRYTAGFVPGEVDIGASYGTIAAHMTIYLTSSIPRYIDLSATPTIITVGSDSAILLTATVSDSNFRPVSDGTPITFWAEDGTFRSTPRATRFESRYITHTTDGIATVYLKPSNLAHDVLVAASGFDSLGNLTATDTITVKFVPGAPFSVNVWFSRDTIWANNSDTTTVYAQVFDQFGNHIAGGNTVTFSAPTGSLYTSTALTDTQGIAWTIFRSGNVAGLWNIQASCGAASGVGSIYLKGTIPMHISLFASSMSIPANGTSIDTLSAQVLDSAYGPVSDGTPILFKTTAGNLVPISVSMAFVDSLSSTTRDGYAKVLLRSGTIAGWDTVVAEAISAGGAVIADTLLVDFTPGPPYSINVTVVPETIFAETTATADVYAQVFDSYGNHLRAGTSVNFMITDGTITSTAITDSMGIAHAVVHAARYPVTARITARVGTTVEGTADITYIPCPVATIILSASADTVRVAQNLDIVANVYDSTGGIVSDAVPVSFSARYGTITPPTAFTISGAANAVFTAATVAVPDTIIATVSGIVSDTLVIDVKPGEVARIEVSSDRDSLPADGHSTANITAQLFDAYGNHLLSGNTVSFDASLGTLIPTSSVTDSLGIARTRYQAGTSTGLDIVRATSGSAIGQKELVLYGPQPYLMILTVNPDQIRLGGDTANILVEVYDSFLSPIIDGTVVNLRFLMGTIIPPMATTVDGKINAIYIPDTLVGIDTIIAQCGVLADTQTVKVNAGRCRTITLSAVPETIAADGYSRSSITGRCYDAYGNALPENIPVQLSTTLGSVISPVLTDETGAFTTTLTSSEVIGRATVTATCEDAIEAVDVWFVTSDVAYIIITVTPSVLTADGTSTANVTADVRTSSGEPVPDGTAVSFTATMGTITPIALTSGGIATATLTAPESTGIGWVYANCVGHSDSARVEFVPGEPQMIVLSASPDTIPADGVSQSIITARVYDAHSNPVGRGVRVNFSTDRGIFDYDYGFTDSTGTVTMTLTSVRNAGIAHIRATSGSAEATVEVYFAPLVAARIIVRADSMRLPADGISTTRIIATVLDSSGSPVPDGSPVSFTTSLGVIIPPTAYTDSGDAISTLRAPTTTGIAEIIADAGGGVVGTTYVEIVPGPPANIVMSADPTTIPANGTTTSVITGTVYDAFGNPIGFGHEVRFSTDPLMGSIDSVAYTDSSGNFTTTFHAGIRSGTAFIIANCGAAVGRVAVDLIPTNVANISLTISRTTLIANQTDTATVFGTVYNAAGMPITDRTPVHLEVHGVGTTAGDNGFVLPAIAYTDSGRFSAQYRSGTLAQTAWIIAFVDTIIDSVMVRLIPGEADSIELTITPSSIPADSFSTAAVTAKLYDAYGNALGAGVAVNFSITLGSISPATALTNSAGEAYATIRSSREVGIARVTARSGSAVGSAEIAFTRTDAAMVSVTVEPASITADGVSMSMVRAFVIDSLGNPISDGTPVTFELVVDTLTGDTLGTLLPTIGLTDSGYAAVQFRAGTKVGIARIKACVDTVCGYADITLTAGQADSMVLTVEDTILPADGVSITNVIATVYDRFGNSVGAGRTVTFGALLGTVNPTSTNTNSSGIAYAMFTAGTTPGTARITASCEGAYATADITLTREQPATILVKADPPRITADGISTSTITARLLNSRGELVGDGLPVIFHVRDTLGNPFGTIDTIATTSGGVATVTLTAPTTKGRAIITAEYRTTTDTIIGSTDITYTSGAPATIEIIAIPGTLYAGSDANAEVRIVVLDVHGNIVDPAQSVSISTDLGSIVPTTGFTGDTIICTYTAGSTVGRATITATCGGVTGTAYIWLIPQNVAILSIYADSISLVAGGHSSTGINVYAQDSTGSAVADSTPIFLSSSGGVISPSVVLTSGGWGNATFTSGTSAPETAFVAAVAGAATDTVFITLRPGPPAEIIVVPDTDVLVANGTDTTRVRAYIKDAYGNWAETGLTVDFSATNGYITPTDITHATGDTTGYADAIFRAGTAPGIAIITVNCGGATGQARITLTPADIGEIQVFADSAELPADGSSKTRIYGFVRNTSGGPIADSTVVTLTISPDTMGVMRKGLARTSGGAFADTFVAGIRAGNAWIIAQAGTMRDSVLIRLVGGQPYTIRMTPQRGMIPADSVSTDTIGVVVFDRYGNRVGSGYTVNFTTSLGEVFPASGVTDTMGSTFVFIRSARQTGSALIRGTCGSAHGECTVMLTSTTPTTIMLTSSAYTLTADGSSTAQLTAMVYDTSGHLVSDGVPIFFIVSDTSLGDVMPRVSYTSGGAATATFRAKTKRGLATIRALSDSAHYDEVTILLQAGEPATIVMTATPETISANNIDQSEIVAQIFDSWGNPVSAGLTVNISATLGDMVFTTLVTDDSGRVYDWLKAGLTPGMSQVTASCGAARGVTQVYLRQSQIGTINLTANPTQLTADGTSNSIITATVYDVSGSPATENTKIYFWFQPPGMGTIISPRFTSGGNAVTNFTAGTDVGDGYVWIFAGDTLPPGTTVLDSTLITIVPGPAANMILWADSSHTPPGTLFANGIDNTYIFARVTDAFGNIVPAGQAVTFTTTLGEFVPGNVAYTDTSGIARIQLRAGNTTGNAVITATCGDAYGFTQVTMIPTPVRTVVLDADKLTLTADGVDSTRLRAIVYTVGGGYVSDGVMVHFFTDSGYVRPMPATRTTTDGVAEIMLRADTIARPRVRVYAYAESDTSVSDTASITFTLQPGPPDRIVVDPEATDSATLPADGTSRTYIDVWVYDRYGNPVTPSTAVTFSTDLGSITDVAFTDISGHARATFTSASTTGVATITIRCGERTTTTQIFLEELEARYIVLRSSAVRIIGDGTSTATLTASVYDSAGTPVSDGSIVVFAQDTSAGYTPGIITPTIATTVGGDATATLIAPAASGRTKVYAYAGAVGSSVVDSLIIEFISGPAQIIIIDTTGLMNMVADGSQFEIRAHVYDAFMNPVAIGTPVHFTTTRGTIDSLSYVSSSDGLVITHISSHSAGPGLITATADSATAVASINFNAVEGNWIEVVAVPNRLTADGVSTSEITAILLDTTGGLFTPVSEGTPIRFSLRGLGMLSSTIAFTSGGNASVTLTAGIRVDTLVVIAIGPILPSGDTLMDSVEVILVPGEPHRVEFITSMLHDLPANCVDTELVAVRVLDAKGNLVGAGYDVTFSTTKGAITTTSATNDTGYAFAVYTASCTSGVALVTATCEGHSASAAITLFPLTADSISLYVWPRQLIANGTSHADLVATVYDSTGSPVSAMTLVSFTSTNGHVTPSIARTASGTGQATSTLYSATSVDTAIVVAISGSVADTDTVVFVAGPPAHITLWASDSTILADGADSVRIYAEVRDSFGNIVSPGTPVTFSSTMGTILTDAYTDSNGIATTMFHSGHSPGWAVITATSGSATSTMLIQIIPTDVGTVIVDVTPTSIVANGTDSAVVIVTVRDTLGMPISDGTPVYLSGINLGLLGAYNGTTSSGQFRTSIHSQLSVGVDTLIVTCGGKTAQAVVTFVPGPPANIVLQPNRTSLIANNSDTTLITATVTDAGGNPVGAGTVVNFTIEPTSRGAIWAVGVTDSTGRCVSVFTAGTSPGNVAVHATSGSAEGVCIIQLVPTALAEIDISAGALFLPSNGTATTSLSASVYDSMGFAAPDSTPVRFAKTGGSVSANIYPTLAWTSSGVATSQIMAPIVSGPCSVYAYIDTGAGYLYSETLVITFTPDTSRRFSFMPSSLTLPADGVSSEICTVIVADRFNNLISGETVTLSMSPADLGSVTPTMVVTDSAGRATFTVRSPRHIGNAYVEGTVGGNVGHLPVEFTATTADTIILVALPSRIPADGHSTTQIRATVLDSSGRPISDGVTVAFFTDFGYVVPSDTTHDGLAFSTLTAADTACTATITAICQAETAEVKVIFTAGEPSEVNVYFSQDYDTVGSGTIDSVYGQVLDTLGNPVGEGTLVRLWLSSTGLPEDTCGGGGDICSLGTMADYSVLTDASGRFMTYFTPGTKSGAIWVFAQAGDAVGSDNMILLPQIAHTESIDVDRSHIYVKGSGNIDHAVLTAYIYDRYNNPVKDSTKVIFWFTNYPGGSDPLRQPSLEPSHPTLGQLWSDTVYTLGGRANITVRAGKASGVALVRSSVLDGSGIISEAPRITISSGLPHYISVSRAKCNVKGWERDGVSDSIMVMVLDSMGNPVPNAAVYFTADEGMIIGSATSNDSGFASSIWYSSNPRGDGIVWVKASTRGDSSSSCGGTPGWVCDSVWFYNSGPVTSITLVTNPSTVNADGSSHSTVRAILQDINGNPVTADSVRFTTTVGTITTPVISVGECTISYAEATYTSATVTVDNYCSSTQVAAATVQAQAGYATATTTITLNGGDCSSSNSSISAPSEVISGGTFSVIVNVKDVWGNPICGQSVTLVSAYGASISPSSATTNSTGSVSFSVTAPSGLTDDVTDIITANFGACAVWTTVTYKAP